MTDATATKQGFVERLNGQWHERALWVYLAVVILHWVEHLFQAAQIWILGMPRPEALGALGYVFPWLVKSEVMHFAYALFMLVGLVLLRPGFRGAARGWWTASLAIQAWHLVEHTTLQLQAVAGREPVRIAGARPASSRWSSRAPSSTCSTTWRCSSRWSWRCGCTPVPTRRPSISAPAPTHRSGCSRRA